MSVQPTVTVAIPTLNEERHIDACLDAISAQTYGGIVEVLVVDGGSTDGTESRVSERPGVQWLDNPDRIQAAALNIALRAAKGDIFVRVDGHCLIAPDYVERCVDALRATGAAMVGGCQTMALGGAARERGLAAALTSRFGGGPASFRRADAAGWSDTVYLGAMWTSLALSVGGYDETKITNEDAELAIRMQPAGGVWLDPAVRSVYVPRRSLRALGRQYYRYGVGRAGTMVAHPESVRPRQLAAPVLLAGLATPWRGWVAATYATGVVATSLSVARRDHHAWAAFLAAIPIMHLSWGAGFWTGLVKELRGPRTGRLCSKRMAARS